MKNLILGAVASLVLSAAVLATPATAAPIPSAAGTLITDNDGTLTQVQMMRGERMMMRRRMMMRERMMMRRKMMRRRMMMRGM